MEDEGGVRLSEAIQALRMELSKAQSDGADATLRFRVNPVKLTVQTVLTKEAGGSGKIRWWLIEAGAEGKRGREVTQTLEIELVPMQPGPGGVAVPAEVSDTQAQPEE